MFKKCGDDPWLSTLKPQLFLEHAMITLKFLNLDPQGLITAELHSSKLDKPSHFLVLVKTSHLGLRICLCSFRFPTSLDSLSFGEAVSWHDGHPLSMFQPRIPENDSEWATTTLIFFFKDGRSLFIGSSSCSHSINASPWPWYNMRKP